MASCLKRISAAEEIKPDYIKEGGNKGEFYVRSVESKDTWYNLSFGGDDTLPKCNCPDFCHTGLLCKHFFAVFEHQKEWTWDALPKSYRENPHLCLDDAVVFRSTCDLSHYSTTEDPTDPPLPTFVPQPQVQPKVTKENEITREAMKCRETLKQITSLTHNVEDLDALKELDSSLQSLYSKFMGHQATDENTIPHAKLQQKDKKKGEEKPTKKYVPLPLRRKRNTFANRVGQRASVMRNQYFVNVPVDGKIYVKKKKLKKPTKSGKRTQQQLLMPHFNNQQLTGNKRQLSGAEDEEPASSLFKKAKHEPTPTTQVSDQPIKPTTKKPITNNQVNSEQLTKPITSTQQPANPTNNQQETNNNQSQESSKPATSDQQPPTNYVHNDGPTKPTITNQPNQKPTTSQSKNNKQSTNTHPSQKPTTKQIKNKQPTKLASSQQQIKQKISNQETSQKPTKPTNSQQTINQANNPRAVLVLDDNSRSPDRKSWVKLQDPDDPDSIFTLYDDSSSNTLKKTNWLCDSEIHAGQILLKMKFPCVDGLHDPAISGALVSPAISEFLQIVNTGGHWVCLSTISCRPGNVKIYDSLFQRASPIAIRHSCRMLMHAGDSILFLNEKVQKQIQTSDCGLFALAFATDLCYGIDPVTQSYDQENMRAHYVSCLDSLKMVPFPRSSRRVPYHPNTYKTTVAIFCVCRMPNDNLEYVQCSQCNGWYHPTCMNIPDWVINSRRKWRCDTCRGKNARKPHLH